MKVVRNYEEAPPFVENLKDDKRRQMVKTDNCASLEGCSKFPQNKFFCICGYSFVNIELLLLIYLHLHETCIFKVIKLVHNAINKLIKG